MNHRVLVTDAFNTESAAKLRQTLLGILILLIVLGGVAFVEYHRRGAMGPVVEGHIVAFGSATWDGSDVPLTVRLQDGTARHVIAPRNAIAGCKIGSRIALHLGRYVRVEPQSCR